MMWPRRFGSLCCGLLGAAVIVWAALQPWPEASQAQPAQVQAQSRADFLVASQSQVEIRRMTQRMLMR
jgi:hypothetical protein